MNKKLLIIGAGGHGKVVAETALQSGQWDIAGFCDDTVPVGTIVMDDISIIARLSEIEKISFDSFIVAIGNNQIRKDIFLKLRSRYQPATIIHPFTHVSVHSLIEEGCVILPGAVISYGVKIGADCIIGSNVHIDHDGTIGAHCHIGNGSSIGSNSYISPGHTTQTGLALQSFSHI
jgi:sugar O-acyltransferase (sialic acid O-acetyltransferase NeuD family)